MPSKGGSVSETNTFQTVIATNGLLSFLIFNFDTLMWPNPVNLKSCLFGYNADGVTTFTYPGSNTLNITNVALESNVNVKGKWVFAAQPLNTF